MGIDALGVERSQPDHATHQILPWSGIVIIEGLRLNHVPAGEYLMIATPLKVLGVEAAQRGHSNGFAGSGVMLKY